MEVHYGVSRGITRPHIVLTMDHIAQMRQSLRDELLSARAAGEVPNRDYVNGIQYLLNGLEEVLLDEYRKR